ncbi:MAG: CsiV family protein [Steroidobacteraceae bacterium]
MTRRSARPQRIAAALLMLALVTPLPAALAQTIGAQAAPAQATSSQAATPQPNASQATQPSTGGAATASPATAAAPGTATTVAPTGPAYDIEIVIFRAKVALGQPENWAAETTASATVAGGEASSGSGRVGKLLTVLPASDYRLTPIASRLQSSGTYVPVAHAAWVQTASAWGTRAGFSLQSLGIDVPGLTGVIFFERGEFLHLGMNLDYTMQDPPPALNAPPGTTFVMNETRRVRFYQRNYYDHPAFGVIALVTPARGPRPPGR